VLSRGLSKKFTHFVDLYWY